MANHGNEEAKAAGTAADPAGLMLTIALGDAAAGYGETLKSPAAAETLGELDMAAMGYAAAAAERERTGFGPGVAEAARRASAAALAHGRALLALDGPEGEAR